jgi:hypothetical protein
MLHASFCTFHEALLSLPGGFPGARMQKYIYSLLSKIAFWTADALTAISISHVDHSG